MAKKKAKKKKVAAKKKSAKKVRAKKKPAAQAGSSVANSGSGGGSGGDFVFGERPATFVGNPESNVEAKKDEAQEIDDLIAEQENDDAFNFEDDDQW